jgi:hypothetical protein
MVNRESSRRGFLRMRRLCVDSLATVSVFSLLLSHRWFVFRPIFIVVFANFQFFYAGGWPGGCLVVLLARSARSTEHFSYHRVRYDNVNGKFRCFPWQLDTPLAAGGSLQMKMMTGIGAAKEYEVPAFK